MYAQVDPSLCIIQKYGGTSVATVERIQKIAERTKRLRERGFSKLAIVVSAQAGETNRLISLITSANPNPPRDAYDMAVAAGEQVSVALMAAALDNLGVKAKPMLAHQLGIRTSSLHSSARIEHINSTLADAIWAEDGVAVVAGFQGVSTDGGLTTLGRGGSDTSAVALAVALKASFCEINTDVNGLYSADPRVVKNAKLIETVDYDVALEMASLGSKVLHPRSVELGKKWGMPLVVRNTFEPDDVERTVVRVFDENEKLEAPVVSGVSVEKNVMRVTIDQLINQPALLATLFKQLATAGVNVDIIVFNRDEKSDTMRLGFTVEGGADAPISKIMDAFIGEAGTKESSWHLTRDMAKISIVGVGMHSHPGVAQRMFNSLSEANIDIEMISTSEIKVSCVIEAKHADTAANVVHQEFH